MVIFELRWAQVAERGVEPPSVVDVFNARRRSAVTSAIVAHQIDGLDLRLDAALGLGCITGWDACSANTS